MRTLSSHDELLEGYLAHAEAVAHERRDTSFWAFNELADLMRDDPDGAWQITVELVSRASDETMKRCERASRGGHATR